MEVYTFKTPQPRVLVVSHERSGTHFLMNALSKGFEYVSNPWIDFDRRVTNLNFFHPPSVVEFFANFRGHNVANTFKSHHSADFFRGVVGNVTEVFTILYVYRDPRDVMRSFWKYVQAWPWLEGPHTTTMGEFARAEPCGNLMRYQVHQAPTMLHRWARHVDGWLDAAEHDPRFILVAFEDLRDDYAGTIKAIGRELGVEPVGYEPPAKDQDGILPGTGTVNAAAAAYSDEDLAFFAEVAGKTMMRLGYRV